MKVVIMRTGPNRGLSAGQEKVRPEKKVKGEHDIKIRRFWCILIMRCVISTTDNNDSCDHRYQLKRRILNRCD